VPVQAPTASPERLRPEDAAFYLTREPLVRVYWVKRTDLVQLLELFGRRS